MSTLQNARYEAFAVARAKGAGLGAAYEEAGFVGGSGNASKLAGRPDIAARVAELRDELAVGQGASPQAIVAALMRMARACEELKSAEGLKEARLHLMEAHKIQSRLSKARHLEHRPPPARRPS